MSFVPSCGQCKSCPQDKAYSATRRHPVNIGMPDGRIAHTKDGETSPVRPARRLQRDQLLSEASVVKVDADIPWRGGLHLCGRGYRLRSP